MHFTTILFIAILALIVLTTLFYRKSGGEFFANAQLAKRHVTGSYSKIADAAFTSRYLLAKFGTDVDHIAICTAADIPIGVVTDETGADSDLTLPLCVSLFGSSGGSTQIVQASGAIALGAFVVPDAAGQVKTITGAGAGTYYIVGRALQAATNAGDQIEIDPIPCVQRVI